MAPFSLVDTPSPTECHGMMGLTLSTQDASTIVVTLCSQRAGVRSRAAVVCEAQFTPSQLGPTHERTAVAPKPGSCQELRITTGTGSPGRAQVAKRIDTRVANPTATHTPLKVLGAN
eukprot:CAMPEP_0175920374 /NCGR_PEP_ID=MMETSP0108-20121206/12893_1 /TAXON_ID=195067 ORGANISM="Goniomonas pacifica, Strain CCMP1869" /NCGR_SAMPLE_ID=MMETSP0108 /ASSEMBLY_ACC=CAM_ASM_000204 /LENGTH=116 /DNA_ID=CAMNT_0017243083 /DNA_START=227 /DNA_END=577 /DNA_ORIENTATION=+